VYLRGVTSGNGLFVHPHLS